MASSRALALVLACAAPLAAVRLDALWPNVCTTEGTPSTRCDADGTCCGSFFSVSKYGCCPWPDAVCCPVPPGSRASNCCPRGTTCRDTGADLSTVTECVDANGAVVAQGRSVCKPGAPLPPSPTLKNVLVVGDSVSIGYTPLVADLLSDTALVQHAPWDTSDGGAEETAYGLLCLKYFLHSPVGVPLEPDVLLFNWGLHDGPLGNATNPGQQGNTTHYAEELAAIVRGLQAQLPRAQLLFALTTPQMCSAVADGCVRNLNAQAQAVMAAAGVPTLDLHTPIVDACGGAVPNPKCFGSDSCFCPHCPGAGYQFIAESTIAPRLREMLGE